MITKGQRQSTNIDDRTNEYPNRGPKSKFGYDTMDQMSPDPMVQDQLRQQKAARHYQRDQRTKATANTLKPDGDAIKTMLDKLDKQAGIPKTTPKGDRIPRNNPFKKAAGAQ